LVVVDLVVQKVNPVQQVTVQMVVILYFLPLHLLVVAVALLAVLPVLERQALLVVAADTMVVLVALEHQVKETMVERLEALLLLAAAVVMAL
jgi:hypothetical protein